MGKSPSTTRDTRLDLRLKSEHKALIKRAAELTGQSLTNFATSSLVEHAHQVIQQSETTQLSDRDRNLFLKLLDSDTKPNAALKRAAKAYKKQQG